MQVDDRGRVITFGWGKYGQLGHGNRKHAPFLWFHFYKVHFAEPDQAGAGSGPVFISTLENTLRAMEKGKFVLLRCWFKSCFCCSDLASAQRSGAPDARGGVGGGRARRAHRRRLAAHDGVQLPGHPLRLGLE